MKVILAYLVPGGDDVYGTAFEDTRECDVDWSYQIDSTAILPVGTKISLLDPATGEGVDFIVEGLLFEPDENMLSLNVVTEASMEISPADFVRYIQKKWIPGDKIYERCKQQ